MRISFKHAAAVSAAAAAAFGIAVVAGPSSASASFDSAGNLATNAFVRANARVGMPNDTLAPGLVDTSVAWGQLPVNGTSAFGNTHYGYNTSDGKTTLTQNAAEAYKTEPDKNVYLVFGNHHYLYQGHEGGPSGYVTRIDLDQTDPSKKVSLVGEADANGGKLPTFDGITWDPWTHQLLLTAESKAPAGGVFALSLDANGDPVDGKISKLPALGQGGYEGIQNDSLGNVWLVEDIGGSSANGGKVPNSYVYRFTPTDKADLTKGGKLEALQVLRHDGTPVTAAQLKANPSDSFIADLHKPTAMFRTAWATVADPSNATTGAAAAGATPFKRPENGVFRPGTNFREFYFTETGDTTATSTLPGAYGGVFRLSMSSPGASTGTITPAALGTKEHTGFDNIAFATTNDLLVVEDAGDGLHAQRNALDSGYLFHVGSIGVAQPVRWLAEGRDASATYDATTSPGYNDGDNEVTGIHVSDGDVTTGGVLGAKAPKPFSKGWRVFWTQQHGDNTTWEVTQG